jgi:GntR family transcriptional regulator
VGVTIHPYTAALGEAFMFLRIDPASGVPIYRQIMDGVRYSVASGTIAPGDRLPSVRELATTLGVNPTTIQKAYGELEHLAVIETRRGQGTFVADRPPEVADGERERRFLSELSDALVRGAEEGLDEARIRELAARALREFYETGEG